MKLIMENWKRFLTERDPTPEEWEAAGRKREQELKANPVAWYKEKERMKAAQEWAKSSLLPYTKEEKQKAFLDYWARPL